MKVMVVNDGEEVEVLHVEPTERLLGRAPGNHVVLPEATVSSRHAAIWVEAGRAWLRDTGSRNGTFVNDQRIRGPVELRDGDRIRLGMSTDLVVRGEVAPGAGRRTPLLWLVEDVDSGVRFPLHGGRFYAGSGPNNHLHVEDAGGHDVALRVDADGEATLSNLDGDVSIELGQVFPVGSRKFRLIQVPATYTPTIESEPVRFPYKLSVTLEGVAGPEAHIEDTQSGLKHTISAENRAVLLFVLARRLADAGADAPEEDTWCADEDVARDIWGKRGSSDANSLHVLVHRLRKELKKAGFDPWFIEKRRKAIRIALTDVSVN